MSLQVGGGTVLSGALSQIDWASGPYFIKTETDPSGGTNYSITGTSQMLSVPYALFSANGTPGPQGPGKLVHKAQSDKQVRPAQPEPPAAMEKTPSFEPPLRPPEPIAPTVE